MNKILGILLIVLLSGCLNKNQNQSYVISKTKYICDESRQRIIPTEIYSQLNENNLNGEVVILSAGYGCTNTSYSYISKHLAKRGYLVVCIQHELQTDEMLASGSDMYKLRLPNWKEGVSSIEIVLDYVRANYSSIDCDKINLIGHSNGGDISMLFTKLHTEKVKTCITLDHRRMPIPRTNKAKMMTIRADQYIADLGVLPDSLEMETYNIKVINLKNVEHNYLRDNATSKTKDIVIKNIETLIE